MITATLVLAICTLCGCHTGIALAIMCICDIVVFGILEIIDLLW